MKPLSGAPSNSPPSGSSPYVRRTTSSLGCMTSRMTSPTSTATATHRSVAASTNVPSGMTNPLDTVSSSP